MIEAIRRMEGGQSHLTLRRDLNMAPSTVIIIMKNTDKIKKTMATARKKTDTSLGGPVIGKME
jgi:hypothetical protein